MKDILSEIVERRKKDIEKNGLEFGFDIPKTRARKLHPFLEKKGVILEVKRASPSKGDIAPNLDSAQTAKSYAQAGAAAISCLTETNYFKGTLQDLMNVCQAVDDFEKESGRTGPAVLRKDFLLSADEVEIAYRAGADAVLLIARILSEETMVSMAKKCSFLGMTALVELRTDEDCEKLEKTVAAAGKENIVCGVNSRDLKDFSIDLLTPCMMLSKIRRIMGENARVIFESGVRTPSSASFVGSLGFSGLLLGEAAAKNMKLRKDFVDSFTQAEETPNARFWRKFTEKRLLEGKKPLVKICGLTNRDDAKKACELGADILGFIFWEKSPRKVSAPVVREMKDFPAIKAGVIVDPDLPESKEAIELVKNGFLDVLQVHSMDGARKFLSDRELSALPHYCAVNLSGSDDAKNLDELFDMGEPRVLVDAQAKGKIGGTGTMLSEELVALAQKKYRLWLAGGLNEANVAEAAEKFLPELIDTASGVEESPGKKDYKKMTEFFAALGK